MNISIINASFLIKNYRKTVKIPLDIGGQNDYNRDYRGDFCKKALRRIFQ